MAAIEQLNTMDPQSREELREHLRETDPELFPLVVQSIRTRMAYRRQADQGRPTVASGFPTAGSPAGTPPMEPIATAVRPWPPAQRGSSAEADSGRIGRLPPPTDVLSPPQGAPRENYPRTENPLPVEGRRPNPPGHEPTAPTPQAGKVVAASHHSTETDDWRVHLASATRALEAEIQGPVATQEDIARHARLRLLYVLADRREDAVRPIPPIGNATPGQGGPRSHGNQGRPAREFWSKQTHALATWLDTERTPNTVTRTGMTKSILAEAVASLGEAAPLEVRNPVFAKELGSYGCYEPFTKNVFRPGQEVILYAEVENFSNQPTAKGYHISLQCRYEIYDTQGRRIVDHDLAKTGGDCRNRRRDYFVAYRMRMPPHLNSGQYWLKLTVEDLGSNRIAESQLSFSIERPN